MIYHNCKVWELAMCKANAPPFHDHTPLWGNPHLPELLRVPDYGLWVDRVVIYVFNVQSQDLFFHYLQLHHALHTQYGYSIPILDSLFLLDVPIGSDSQKIGFL